MKLSELKKIAEARTESEWYPDWWLTHPRTWRAVCVPTNNEIESRNNAQFISTFANHADALLKVVEAAKFICEISSHYDHVYLNVETVEMLKKALEELENIK